jgi:AcrR family transcriptional regulator
MTSGPKARDTYHHGDLRKALLAAAERELAENGIEGFSLRGVAKRAGVSHAAPLHHFKDTRVLLTALAAHGFERFLSAQKARQAKSEADSLSQLVASGMGYIDFALAHPAIFRLMFSSDRPDHEAPDLVAAASAAYDQLIRDVARVHGCEPNADNPSLMTEALKAWGLAHGLADLMTSGRLKYLIGLKKTEREKTLVALLRQSFEPSVCQSASTIHP